MAAVIDTSVPIGKWLRDNVARIFEKLAIKQAESYQLLQYGMWITSDDQYPKQTSYPDFHFNLTNSIVFPEKNNTPVRGGTFFRNGK